MSKNGIILSVMAVVLAVIYVFYFTDWFQKETIQIIPTVRPGRPSAIPRPDNSPQVCPVSFAFDAKCRLTMVKVVAEEDMKTNKYPLALWHVISDSGSPPTKSIMYGQLLKNMKPAIPRARPEPLQPNVRYVLLVEAERGKVKAQTNFFTRELINPVPQ